MTTLRAMKRLLLLALALALAACSPSPGPFRLAAVSGRVVDQDTGRPIGGATVFEWHRGGGLPRAAQPELHARWTTTGEDGRFAFPRELVVSPHVWTQKVYGPTLSFYHSRYGLVHAGAPAGAGETLLRGSRRAAAARRADLAPYCRGERTGAGARHLAAIACVERPIRPER